MKTALFDIEADGLNPTKIHCLSVICPEKDKEEFFGPKEILRGAKFMADEFDQYVAHNGIGYDYPVMERLAGLVVPEPKALDSLVLSRVLFGNMGEVDKDNYFRNGKLPGLGISVPGGMIGRHGLEAWGWRVGLYKGDYSTEMKAKGIDPWAEYNDDMGEYCVNDTRVLRIMWERYIAPKLGMRVFNFRTRVRFFGYTGSSRGEPSEVLVTLPPDAYSRTNIPMGMEIVKQALASNEIPPNMGPIKRIVFEELPGFLNSTVNYIDDRQRSPHAGMRRYAFSPIAPSTDYEKVLCRARPSKKLEIRHFGDEENRDAFRTALENVCFTPQVSNTPQEVIDLEHFMARRMEEVKRHGILFDVKRGTEIEHELRVQFGAIAYDLAKMFPPRREVRSYERKRKKPLPVLADDPVAAAIARASGMVYVTKIIPFKPSSRKQVGERLVSAGWVPDAADKTATGQVKVSDDILGKAEAYFKDRHMTDMESAVKKLRTYYLIQKRIGQLASGKQAWLKLVDSNGFIHPTINPCAAVTARATHSNPNISQVPALLMKKGPNPDYSDDPALVEELKSLKARVEADVSLNAAMDLVCDAKSPDEAAAASLAFDGALAALSGEFARIKLLEKITSKTTETVAWGEEGEWGADCRKLFIVPPGFKQVGADLAGIELRMLAHYLFKYDHGNFIRVLLTKDVHDENRRIIGFANRTDAKRFIFALLYGAGDEKLGSIIMPSGTTEQKKALGRQFRDRCAKGIIGFGDLVKEVKFEASSGFIRALDNRLLPIRAQHAALNTLLQSGGAIISKVWIYHIFQLLWKEGMVMGYDNDYCFLLWSHDEVQFAVREKHAKRVAEICKEAAILAGQTLGSLVPIAADAKIGDNWFDTH